MPKSSLSESLGSLSSPSPSPTPPPKPATNDQGRSAASSSKPPVSAADSNQTSNNAATGLDTDSELSELTEDEQDNTQRSTNSKKTISVPDDDEQDYMDTDKLSNSHRRTAKTRRRKRSSIVPAPMWGWASKEQRALEAMEEEEASRQEEEEEEEEEESANGPPPRAMEEEEDDDEGEEDGDGEERARPQPKNQQPDSWRSGKPGKSQRSRRSRKVSYREKLDDDDDDTDPTYKRNNVPSSARSRVNGVALNEEQANSDAGSPSRPRNWEASHVPHQEEGEVSDQSDAPLPTVRKQPPRRAPPMSSKTHSKPVEDEEEEEEEEEEEDPASDAELGATRSGDEASGNETESEADDAPAPVVAPKAHLSPTNPLSPSKLANPEPKPTPTRNPKLSNDVPESLQTIAAITTIAAAAAASSIMAGSNIVGKDADHHCPGSSPDGSLAPSAKGSDDEDEHRGRMSLASVTKQRRESLIGAEMEPALAKGNSKLLGPDGDVDMDGDVEVDALLPEDVNDHDQEGDRSVGDVDNDLDVDVDGDDQDRADGDQDNDEHADGDNEDDLDNDNELESDLQPAHRAEALDVLASIELKFALLRERVYVEKMESLAWEEELVNQASHPEMAYLLGELKNRRDKRLELAHRKRLHEIANIGKRRRADEAATWSWWMFTRDELQTDMISETSRKRRRLDRDRRAIERPQPARRLPAPPTVLPQAPSLLQVLTDIPYAGKKTKSQLANPSINVFVYPELPTLSANDVSADLEYLLQNRRHPSAYDVHMNRFSNLSNGPIAGPGGGIRSAYDPHQYAMTPVDAYGRPLPQPLPGFPSYGHHQLPHTSTVNQPIHGYPPYGNVPPPAHHPAPPPQASANHNRHLPSDRDRERGGARDMDADLGAGHQVIPNHPYFGRNSGPSNPYPPPPQGQPQQNGRRRSPSPVAGPNGVEGSGKHGGPAAAPAPGTWLGPGMGMGYVPVAVGKGDWNEGRSASGSMDAIIDNDDRERMADRERMSRDWEREHGAEYAREKMRERDQREKERVPREQAAREQHLIERAKQYERDRDLQHPPQAGHQHRQGPSHQPLHGPSTVPHHHHHRPHHHHVVHHHHGQHPSTQAPSSLNAHSSSSVPPTGHSHVHDNRGHLSSDPPRNHSVDYRDRERESHQDKEKEGERDTRMQPPPMGRPRSGPPLSVDDRERPASIPLVLASSQPPHLNNSSSSSQMNNGAPRPPWAATTPASPRRPPPPPSPSSSYSKLVVQSPPRYGPPAPPSMVAPRSPPVNMKMRPASPLTSKIPPPPNSGGSAYNQSPRQNGPGRTSTPTYVLEGKGPSSRPTGFNNTVNAAATASGRGRSASPPPRVNNARPAPIPFGPLPPPTANGDARVSPLIAGLPPHPSKMSLPQMIDGH